MVTYRRTMAGLALALAMGLTGGWLIDGWAGVGMVLCISGTILGLVVIMAAMESWD